MEITIDTQSGFCFGVVHAIEVAERELESSGKLYCLGDIVHNNMEVNRLKNMGLEIITHPDLERLRDCKVMIRAHGEPPETYLTALRNNIELIDASCPIVLHLQQEIRHGYEESLKNNGQIVIYGQEGHAEVNGLKGQTNGKAIVAGNESDLEKIDFTRPVHLFSQTTKGVEGFRGLVSMIAERMKQANPENPASFLWNDTICRQVSNRSAHLRQFSARFDAVIFVTGRNSSNGRILYQICKEVNEHTYMVSEKSELSREWFQDCTSVGVCGATSTPMWLMQEVADEIGKMATDDVSA
jgi:4-hydroxy-3-methylbut-2-enyl diphosphate reductase